MDVRPLRGGGDGTVSVVSIGKQLPQDNGVVSVGEAGGHHVVAAQVELKTTFVNASPHFSFKS
jgi:hypothetical protein